MNRDSGGPHRSGAKQVVFRRLICGKRGCMDRFKVPDKLTRDFVDYLQPSQRPPKSQTEKTCQPDRDAVQGYFSPW